MKTLVLIKTLFKKGLIEFRRYFFETISALITLLLFFVALFFGARSLAGSPAEFGDTPGALVVGYILWALAIFMYSSSAQNMAQEAQLGTLEQLAMSPLGLSRVVLVSSFVGMLFQFIIMAVLLMLMIVITQTDLNLDIASILPIAIVTLTSVVGLGLFLGGLAIVFKRVQSALQIMQMAFIAFVALPIDRFGFLKFMPLALGNDLLRSVMIDDASIGSLPRGDLAFLVAHAVAYMIVGLLVFKWLERVARTRGLLGHY